VKCVAEGAVPLMVNATCGTTVYGAYDPLEDIANVCLRHKVWMHVDACWGGGALVVPKRKPLMKGVEKSDSMAWCLHKILGSPLQCCPFVTKHPGLLGECHSSGASYLFQRDKNYDVRFDIGDKSIQCSRKVDALKMWTIWKAKGDAGLGAETEAAFSLAEYFHARISDAPGFRHVYDGGPQCTNVCFWYIPERLRVATATSCNGNTNAEPGAETERGAVIETGYSPESGSLEPENSSLEPKNSCLKSESSNPEPESSNLEPESSNLEPESSSLEPESSCWWAEVGRVAPHVKRRMMERGSMLIGYQPFKDKTNFFRLVITRKPYLNEKHMDQIIKEIALLGEESF